MPRRRDDDPPTRSEARALAFNLFTIKLRQTARAAYDKLPLGKGAGVRLVAALIVATVFVFACLAVSLAAKAGAQTSLGIGGALLVVFFIPSAVLILWASDEQLADDRHRIERELDYARECFAWDDARREEAERRDARRERERDEYNDRPRRRNDDRVGYRCPFCRCREYPVIYTKVSTAGLLFFWLTCLFLCWPICWIGLLMRDTYRMCPECGMKLG